MMNKYEIEKAKKEEFISQLKKVNKEDWVNLKPGTLLFNQRSTNIKYADRFDSFTDGQEYGGDEYSTVVYTNDENEQYSTGVKDWYYYDECVCDEIEEKYSIKLFQFDTHLIVATTDEDLYRKVNGIVKEKTFTWDYFKMIKEMGTIKQIKDVEGYEIVLR